MKYQSNSFNKIVENEQWIRITDGCPNQCEFCYCPSEKNYYGIPKIEKNYVKILDMNLLCFDNAIDIISELGSRRVNEKKVKYELVCGIDYRYLTKELAELLKKSNFVKIRFAFDGSLKTQYKMKDTLNLLRRAKFDDISVFILANHKISLEDCLFKLDLLKVWNCIACDCYYNGQVFPNIKPEFWTIEECKYFRKKCRKHNQIVLFGIDPQPNFKIPFKLKKNQKTLLEF